MVGTEKPKRLWWNCQRYKWPSYHFCWSIFGSLPESHSSKVAGSHWHGIRCVGQLDDAAAAHDGYGGIDAPGRLDRVTLI